MVVECLNSTYVQLASQNSVVARRDSVGTFIGGIRFILVRSTEIRQSLGLTDSPVSEGSKIIPLSVLAPEQTTERCFY